MTTTERLLAATEDIWAEYYTHPFVRGIADGTLDREKFRYYMIQDYLYLIDYAKVFAVGVSKAKDGEAMKLFAGYVHQILDGEMDIHRTNPDAEQHPFYGEWVQGYAAPEYAEANRILVELTNRLTAEYSTRQLQHLIEIFVNCSRYELAFWDMAWQVKK